MTQHDESIFYSWEPLIGFEYTYEINGWGHIRKIKNQQLIRARMMPQSASLTVILRKDNKTHSRSLPLLVAKQFIPNPDNHEKVIFLDGNKYNVAVTNLNWISKSDYYKCLWFSGNMENNRRALENKSIKWKQNMVAAGVAHNAIIKTWYHPQFGEFIGSMSELIRQYPLLKLDQGALSKVLNRKQYTHRDWRVK